jgi:predicted Rossmann fold nucleotide-binding protein DprA/Smf involved in DNA uptake
MEIVETTAKKTSRTLCEIPDPPRRLWMAGTPAPTGHKYLCVVGSRALTPYGRDVTARLISGLSGEAA